MKRVQYIIAIGVIYVLAFAGAFSASCETKISLLTCMPGPEIYELNGHSALRIVTEHGDSVWNYGLFSFDQPNFVYRFVKGETDYMAGAYPTGWFLPDYSLRGSRVYEQELLLSPEEKERLLEIIRNDIKPENSVYRYNYIKDNCATRIRDNIEQAVGEIRYTDTLHYGSYRKEMTAHHSNYPWYQFGIDLALGSGLDVPVTSRDEMFAPDEMMRRFATAVRPDGRPVVGPAKVIVEGSDAAILGPTPRWCSPLSVCWIIFLISTGIAIYGFVRKRALHWWYALYFAVTGLGGCVIAFLVFVSTHEATSPNMLIFWLNPLQLIVPACIWSRRTRPAVTVMMWYNLVVVGIMLLLWGFGRQVANPSFFPLMGSCVVLGAGWLMLPSEKGNGKRGSGSTGRGKSGKGKASGRVRKEKRIK